MVNNAYYLGLYMLLIMVNEFLPDKILTLDSFIEILEAVDQKIDWYNK